MKQTDWLSNGDIRIKLRCDRCGAGAEFKARSKRQVEALVRAGGWRQRGAEVYCSAVCATLNGINGHES